MKYTLLYIIIPALMCSETATARRAGKDVTDTAAVQRVEGVSVSDVRIEHTGNLLTVDMTIDLGELEVDRNRAVLITPRLANGNDSIELPTVGIYGRRRHQYYVRNGVPQLTGSMEKVFKARKKLERIEYGTILPYEKWMDGASLSLCRSEWGCCNTMLAEQSTILGEHREEFFPELVYVSPTGRIEKHDSIEGTAYIDFPTNQTAIYQDYRRNAQELEKIRETIDSIRSDRDITITSVWLKGYASPEGAYAHNEELAIGRTEALKRHIRQLYDFREELIATEHEAEDWKGLRRYVENSNLANRADILEIIDSDMEPDAKEDRIRKAYPEDYRFLLQNCYPALRHTDYRIEYSIRTYSDVEEIKKVLHTKPQKLGLNEFYLAAQGLEAGTEEFKEVFETAVRMYPEDETANLNAANAAMRLGDYSAAARYLEKAGDSPQAIYARGALAIQRKEYDAARRYLEKARELGLKEAEETLRELERGRR